MTTKNLFSIALIVAVQWTAAAQQYITQVKPADSKTWGYANSKGELIIPAQYQKCYKFSSDGLAPIYDTEKKQWYFINTKGEALKAEISNFRLVENFGIELEGFNSGLVAVRQEDKLGFLNTQGKLAIPVKYDKVNEFDHGYTTVEAGGKFFVLDTKGTETAVDVPGLLEVKKMTEKLAPFKAADKKIGFIGVNGKIAIPAQFESVGYFHGGLAWAKDFNKMVGYINTTGEWVIKPTFTAGKDFDPVSGMARIKEGEQWAYVSKTGEVVRVADTETYGDFADGLADGKKGGKVGFFNNKGQWVIAPQFEGAREFKNGLASAKLNGKWGAINKEGKWVIEPKFDGIKDFELVK